MQIITAKRSYSVELKEFHFPSPEEAIQGIRPVHVDAP